ncbi:MAG: hypothetical protein AEth_01175 [Candidatus Argoarchaeum ethanivorans]|uniref:Uncharacterized protein n=1 Tax=Candidatus Argoarchaeum ethanivorans TaxID=2608793 RepID=A0A8B3S193_9EURY|nr:MAG: hypothetical protein AEth_01175 [Candidatus Argoarchaeum ethanivorans]
MAMYLEKKAAVSYEECDYRAAEQRFTKAAKMYRDAGLHAESRDAREGLFASSNFCMGWAHLTQVMHLVLNQKHDDLHLLQSELNQARISSITWLNLMKRRYTRLNLIYLAN